MSWGMKEEIFEEYELYQSMELRGSRTGEWLRHEQWKTGLRAVVLRGAWRNVWFTLSLLAPFFARTPSLLCFQ